MSSVGERGRHVVATRSDRRRRLGQLRGEQLLRRAAVERRRADEHLVADDAERIEIGAMIGVRIAGGLLGRHVRRRADRRADERDRARSRRCVCGSVRRFARRRDRLRDAEVRDRRRAAGQQNVVGLDVAVNDAAAVRVRRARARRP